MRNVIGTVKCKTCNDTKFEAIDQVPNDIRLEGFDAIIDWIDHQKYMFDGIGGCTCHINSPCSACVDFSNDVDICPDCDTRIRPCDTCKKDTPWVTLTWRNGYCLCIRCISYIWDEEKRTKL